MNEQSVIGFIGTGIMGSHMARRLSQAGFALRAWNRTRAKVEALQAAGAQVADTAIAAGAQADAVVVMLSDGPTCDRVLLQNGAHGAPVLPAMRPGALLLVMSSIPVETAQHLDEQARRRGIDCLDAPVSGGEKGAAEGALAIMAGGSEDAFARAAPLFDALGRATLVGGPGSGQLAKLANQLIVANTVATVAEALLFAQRGGASPAKVREALSGGFADSIILRQQGARMCREDWRPGGPAKHQVKDQRTALALARKLGLELPLSSTALEIFSDMLGHGDGELDHSAVYRELERHNKLR